MHISAIANSENWKALDVPIRMILGVALPKHDLLAGLRETRPTEPQIHQRLATKLLEDPLVQSVIRDFAVAEYNDSLATKLATDLMAELTGKLNAALGVAAAPVTPALAEVAK